MSDDLSVSERIKAQFREFEDRLDKLDTKSRTFEATLKQQFDLHSPKIRDLIREGVANADKLKDLTEEDSQRFAGHFEDTIDALKESMSIFMSQFEGDDEAAMADAINAPAKAEDWDGDPSE
jgi:hypothetical protein